MKALVVRQPYASLIAIGTKTFETRSWPPYHRGPLLIVAGKNRTHITELKKAAKLLSPVNMGIDSLVEEFKITPFQRYAIQALWMADLWPDNIQDVFNPGLPLGMAVCVVNILTRHVGSDIAPTLSPQELAFGDYSASSIAWNFDGLQRLVKPFSVVGREKIFDVPYEYKGNRLVPLSTQESEDAYLLHG